MTALCRDALKGYYNRPDTPHAGLWLSRGMTVWLDSTAAGEAKAKHIDDITSLKPCKGYTLAFKRWQGWTNDKTRFVCFDAKLSSRLYIGVTRDNPSETGVTVSHTWGMPMIPGSAIKGLARASTAEWLNTQISSDVKADEVLRYVFGAVKDPFDDNSVDESGGLVFHDAWWMPNDAKPFVAEVVTPHHTGYYDEGKEAATDFDSPIPVPQIAVTGGFYFVIEGDTAWANLARRLLQKGLREQGIGSKRSSGYGAFESPQT